MTCRLPALAYYRGEAVAHLPYAHVPSLLTLVEGEQVEAVGGHTVGRASEGGYPEEEQRALQPMGRGYGESHAAKGRAQQELRGEDPPPLGLHKVDEGTPDGLENPGEVHPRGVERDGGVGQSHLLIEDERHRHHGHQGQSVGKGERGHPGPRLVPWSADRGAGVLLVIVKCLYHAFSISAPG